MKKYSYVKKLLTLILSFTMVISSLNAVILTTNAVETTNEINFTKGDVNNDNCIDIIDVTEIQRGIADIIQLNETQLKVGDVTNDDITDIKDATLIQKFLVGIIDSFGPTEDTILPTDIILNLDTITLVEGYSKKLTAQISPDNASDLTVKWTSENEEVATVDDSGVVTAIATGVTDIIAETVNGLQTTCSVEVLPKYTTLPANGIVSNTEIALRSETVEDINYYCIPNPQPEDRFLMVGQQTNFSLLKSVPYVSYNQSFEHRLLLDSYMEYGVRVWRPNLVSNDYPPQHGYYPIDSQFPIIFTDPIKLDTYYDRAALKAYNEGIYLLGQYNLSNNPDYGNLDVNVAMFTNNHNFESQFHCNLLVLGNNIAALNNNAVNVCSYAKDTITYNGNKGVVLYVPKTVYVYVGSAQVDRFESGYYFLVTDKYDSHSQVYYASLFNCPNRISIDTSDISRLPISIQEIIKSNLYSSLVNQNSYISTLKDIHGASEVNRKYLDVDRVQITYDNGTFSDNPKIYNPAHATRWGLSSVGSRTSYYSKWDTASIYCAPNEMPNSGTRYDLYCGKSFNFLWYSINDMVVKSNSKIFIASENNVLTIGPDYGERIEKITEAWGTYYASNHNGRGVGSSNVIKATDSGSAFYICPSPYATNERDRNTITLTVMNDFVVQSNNWKYTIYRGVYIIPRYDCDNKMLWSDDSGLNLFSDKALEYFSKFSRASCPYNPNETVTFFEEIIVTHTDFYQSINAWELPCNWVTYDTSKRVNDTTPVDLSLSQSNNVDYFVDFEALSGQIHSKNYKATSIDVKFGDDIVINNANLSARRISISADKITGRGLYIDTWSMNKELYDYYDEVSYLPRFLSNDEDSEYVYGQIIEFESSNGETVLCDLSGNPTGTTIKSGTYFIPTTNSIDITNPESWYGTQNYYLFKPDGATEYIKVMKTES